MKQRAAVILGALVVYILFLVALFAPGPAPTETREGFGFLSFLKGLASIFFGPDINYFHVADDDMLQYRTCISMYPHIYWNNTLDHTPFWTKYYPNFHSYRDLKAMITSDLQQLRASMGRPVPGPAFVLTAFDPEKQYMEGYLYVVGVTKDLRPAPNLDYIGRAHHWIYRLLYIPTFADPHRIEGKNQTNGTCAMRTPDDGAIHYQRHAGPHIPFKSRNIDETFLPAGCRTDDSQRCIHPPQPPDNPIVHIFKAIVNVFKKIINFFKTIGEILTGKFDLSMSMHPPKTPKLFFYAVFQIKGSYGPFASIFEPGTMDTVHHNILPQNQNMYANCWSQLVSDNNRYVMRMEAGSMSIYLNTGNENLDSLCTDGKLPSGLVPIWRLPIDPTALGVGYPWNPESLNPYLSLEAASLSIYGHFPDPRYPDSTQDTVERTIWSIKLAEGTYVPPIALVLTNDGRWEVYDALNNRVTSSTVAQFSNMLQSKANAVSVGMGDTAWATQPYDLVASFMDRIRRLIALLVAQKRLLEMDPAVYDRPIYDDPPETGAPESVQYRESQALYRTG